MSTITFLSADIETKIIKFDLKQAMKDVCKKYADEIKANIKHLVFYSNGQKLHKKMTVSEFIKTNPEKELFVAFMDKNIDSESEEEQKNQKNLIEEFLDYIKNPKREITYEKNKELIVKYGFYCKKRIEKEKKEHPENFIEIEDAIKNKDKNEQLYALGQLGKALENIGIKVAIDKRDIKNDESIIINQIISSGMLQENKYEIHLEENDINKKYAIINNENNEQEKFIDEFKGFISKETSIPRQDIIIENIREGSLIMDVVPKREKKSFRDHMIKLSKFNKIKSIYENNILEACILTLDMLDVRGNRYPSEWPDSCYIKSMIYYPPSNNWIGYGLKVYDQYDNGNNDWFAMDGNPNEWYVAYHGFSTKAVIPICEEGGKFFSNKKEVGSLKKCENYENINMRSRNLYLKCGEGTYVSPYLEYAKFITYQKPSRVIIMCRVNPYKIRIPQGEYGKNEWITDGTRVSIRPYRILVEVN